MHLLLPCHDPWPLTCSVLLLWASKGGCRAAPTPQRQIPVPVRGGARHCHYRYIHPYKSQPRFNCHHTSQQQDYIVSCRNNTPNRQSSSSQYHIRCCHRTRRIDAEYRTGSAVHPSPHSLACGTARTTLGAAQADRCSSVLFSKLPPVGVGVPAPSGGALWAPCHRCVRLGSCHATGGWQAHCLLVRRHCSLPLPLLQLLLLLRLLLLPLPYHHCHHCHHRHHRHQGAHPDHHHHHPDHHHHHHGAAHPGLHQQQ